MTYISNILVLKDPATPENEGKVFLFKYGVKIFNKINEKMNPDEGLGETAFNPFDYWEGADFRLKIRVVEKQVNYDTSMFDSPTALYDGDDEKLKAVYESQYKLEEFLAPSQFKDYDTLKAKLDKVLCLDGSDRAPRNTKTAEQQVEAAAPKAKEAPPKELPAVDIGDGDGDEAMDFLKSLAEKD